MLTRRAEDSVGLIVWSAAEMAVTLICIGIPVCRPLYKRMFQRILGESRTGGGGYQTQSADIDSLALSTIGGGLVGADGKPLSKKRAGGTNTSKSAHTTNHDSADDDASFRDVKLGVNGPFTRTTVGRGVPPPGSSGDGGDDASDEEILDEFRRSQRFQRKMSDVESGLAGHPQDSAGIMVTETYRVERS